MQYNVKNGLSSLNRNEIKVVYFPRPQHWLEHIKRNILQLLFMISDLINKKVDSAEKHYKA